MKFLFTLLLFLNFSALSSQEYDWHHLDPEEDGVLGVSSLRAYRLLEGRDPKTVIVAIIDNGAELTHEDLQGTFWRNPAEVEGNGVDDDGNGYVDDIHGWNFLGNAEGENLKYEMTGLTHHFALYSKRFSGVEEDDIVCSEWADYQIYLSLKEEFEGELNRNKNELAYYEKVLSLYNSSDQEIKEYLKRKRYTEEELRELRCKTEELQEAKDFIIKVHDHKLSREGMERQIKKLKSDLATRLNPEFRNREEIVGDDPDDIRDTIYGNSSVDARGPYHGTGVAGLVGALNNDLGVNGIARNVQLMILRVVPNGDERDKDIALAIKYAVRNGADIINCSFAKRYSDHHIFVQDAIAEAERSDVLIVHAAGNMATNNDSIPYYPTGILKNGVKASNFITVGASRPLDNEYLAAFFSNYGKVTVDIFAPGYDIRSCALNSTYDKSSGTSTAAPIVAGIAAVLKSYFPGLSAVQIKDILIHSAYIPKTQNVICPGENKEKYVEFRSLSLSGGIANLYNAVLMAGEMKESF